MPYLHLLVSPYVTLAGLELVVILLPQLFEYCINKCAPPPLAAAFPI